MSYRIDAREHARFPWKAHELMQPDFEIEDVWRMPVSLAAHHSLAQFQEQFRLALTKMMASGLPAKLFELRFLLGRIFGWDGDPQSPGDRVRIDAARPGSLRARYAALPGNSHDNLAPSDHAIDTNFQAVYNLENESLAELENATVHAALHLGRVPDPARVDAYTIDLTVYVKPKGFFGRAYMGLIKPFRLAIVYPAIMRTARAQWDQFLKSE